METENTTQDYIDLAEDAPASIGAAYAAIAQAKALADIAASLRMIAAALVNADGNGLAHLFSIANRMYEQ